MSYDIPTAGSATDRIPYLYGRDSELSELIAAYRSTFAGNGQVVLLSGEPGIGKSALLDRVDAIAAADGVLVIRGSCYEDTPHVPFVPFAETLHQLVIRDPSSLDDLATIDPEGHTSMLVPGLAHAALRRQAERVSELELRRGLFESIALLYARSAERQPLLILLDDLHWVDEGSAQLLRHLVRALRTFRVSIVGAYRDTDVEPDHPLEGILRELSRERTARRTSLRRLSRDGTRAIIERILGTASGSVSPSVVDAIHRESEGVPFFTEELILHLREEGLLERTPTNQWRLLDSPALFVPQSIRSVVGHRLSKLSSPTREALAAAAVIGREFRFDILFKLLRIRETLDAGQLSAYIDEAIARRLVVARRSPDRYDDNDFAFVHEQIREVLYVGLNPIRRRVLHLELARVLETSGGSSRAADAARLASHFAEGQDASAAARYSLQAARAFNRSHAAEEAVYHFQTTLDMLDVAGENMIAVDGSRVSRLNILLELEPLLAEGVDITRHAKTLEMLLAMADASGDAAPLVVSHHRAVLAAIRLGDQARARLHASAVFAINASTGAGNAIDVLFDLVQAETRRVLGEPSNLDATATDLQSAEQHLVEAVRVARETGDGGREARALQELGVVRWSLAGADRDARAAARTCIVEALELFRQVGNRKGEITALIALAYRRGVTSSQKALTVDDSYVSFLEEIRKLRTSEHALARAGQRTRMEALTLLSVHVFCRANGWYETALDRGTQAADLARDLRDLRIQVVAGVGLAETEVLIGRPFAALKHVELALATVQANASAPWVNGQRDALMRVHALAHSLAGNSETALSIAYRRHETATVDGQLTRAIDAETDLAELLVTSDPTSVAAEEYARNVLERTLHLGGGITWDIRAELILGRIRLARGDVDLALGHSVAASARIDAREIAFVPLRIDAGLVRCLTFEAIGHADDARLALVPALELVQRVEIRMQDDQLRAAYMAHNPLRSAVYDAATRLGVLPMLDVSTARKRNEAGLTNREIEVLKLVAAGKTNRDIAEELFISEKTVARHLTNLFTKIDTQSRTQAAAWAFRHDLV